MMKLRKSSLESAKFSNQVTWQSPANIALIKYWGKKGPQIAANPSLSMTLERSFTEMTIQFTDCLKGLKALKFYFNGKPQRQFQKKIMSLLNSLIEELPFLSQLALTIVSKNSFPHSAGIASSASSMSALALCLRSLQNFFNEQEGPEQFFQQASRLARLGSGSACRSVYGGWVSWGKIPGFENSSELWATPLNIPIDPIFQRLQDSVLIVSSQPKATSSRAGHELMENHPFCDSRYEQAQENFQKLLNALSSGNWELFTQVVESEALTLHGLMMSSTPFFILLKPESLKIIEKIEKIRRDKKIPLAFTIDAGPNIHLLYPSSVKQVIRKTIEGNLLEYCENGSVIHDQLGCGPQQVWLA